MGSTNKCALHLDITHIPKASFLSHSNQMSFLFILLFWSVEWKSNQIEELDIPFGHPEDPVHWNEWDTALAIL